MAETTGSYTVLARRYRPQTFDEVVGQQPVAQALRNAIAANRVAHAYLFTGARGVGKTSMARILAKALNCKQSSDGNPCNQCDLCQAISAGSDVDVMEIDGASNRGIDDIRALRANVGIRSMRTQVKIYIIDEVHMLTKEAFNALLKTLEEPPPNVKFVFCTTEPHKVPDTILSRCQRFDFSSIDTQRIAERLTEIAAQEQIEVAADAIELVARRAGGSMRDSQSLFDQLLAFGGDRIEAGDVNALLGTADDDRLLRILEYAFNKQQAELLREIDLSSRDGVQLGNLLDQLINCFRDLLVLSCGADSLELIGVGSGSRQQLESIASSSDLPTISAAMQILSEAKLKLSRVSHARALVDLALIRISLLEDLGNIHELITDLKSGEFQGIAQVSRKTQPPTTTPASPPPPPTPAEPVQSSPSISSPAAHNEIKPAVSHEKPPETHAPSAPVAKSTPAPVSFSDENVDNIWAQLIDMLEDSIKTHLRQGVSPAIIAPNRLDIVFQSQYAFSKSYLEGKPEHLRSLERHLNTLTGQNITVRFLLESKPTTNAAVNGNGARSKSAATQIPKSDFVQAAETIFAASIARAEHIRKPNSQDD